MFAFILAFVRDLLKLELIIAYDRNVDGIRIEIEY